MEAVKKRKNFESASCYFLFISRLGRHMEFLQGEISYVR